MMIKKALYKGSLRKLCAVGSLTIIAAAGVVGVDGQAVAAQRPLGQGPQVPAAKKFHVKYNKNWTFKSKKINRCIFINATGNISYTERVISGRPVNTYYWQHQKLNDPTLKIHIEFRRAHGRCSGTAKLVKVHLRQDWTGYACSFNPSLGFSAPWGISFSLWPSCGNRNQAGYQSSPPGRLSHYEQFNSGSPASFGDYHVDPTPQSVPCYGVYPTIIAYLTGKSDSFGAGDARAQKVCLPWHANF